MFTHAYGSTSGSYPGLDDFNRVSSCVWAKDVTNGPIDFYDVDVHYDRVSNVTLVEDNVYTGWDIAYTMDGLDRLAQADSGTWNGSSITSQTRQEVWELDLAGNWDVNKLDLDGDNDYADAGEFNVAGTFNSVNEQTVRDGNALTYNAVGELTANDTGQKFVWDAFGRLRKVTDSSDALIAQYRYNGLGERIGWQYDVDGDTTVETSGSDDHWFYFLPDDRWRTVATITAINSGGSDAGEYKAKADNDPKELFVFHAAGLSGRGSSSYIDTLILRDADMNGNGGWSGASDGTLEQRAYYCQNWRADVVALLDETGARRESAHYFAYGMPFGMPRSDVDGDGDTDATDYSLAGAAVGKSVGQVGYDVKFDVDLDGTVTIYDTGYISTDNGQSLGRGNLSRGPTLSGGIGNRIGYAGYRWDPEGIKYHVRHRVKDPLTGRWLRRDPIGYVDGASLYEYVASAAHQFTDPMGLTFKNVCRITQPWDDGEGGSGMTAPCTGATEGAGGENWPPDVDSPRPDPLSCSWPRHSDSCWNADRISCIACCAERSGVLNDCIEQKNKDGDHWCRWKNKNDLDGLQRCRDELEERYKRARSNWVFYTATCLYDCYRGTPAPGGPQPVNPGDLE